MASVHYQANGNESTIVFRNLISSDGEPIEIVLTDEFFREYTTFRSADEFYNNLSPGSSLDHIVTEITTDDQIKTWDDLKRLAES